MNDLSEWRPFLGASTGNYRKIQETCPHPDNQRLTSHARRMYCGVCGVDFKFWAIQSSAPVETASTALKIARGLMRLIVFLNPNEGTRLSDNDKAIRAKQIADRLLNDEN